MPPCAVAHDASGIVGSLIGAIIVLLVYRAVTRHHQRVRQKLAGANSDRAQIHASRAVAYAGLAQAAAIEVTATTANRMR